MVRIYSSVFFEQLPVFGGFVEAESDSESELTTMVSLLAIVDSAQEQQCWKFICDSFLQPGTARPPLRRPRTHRSPRQLHFRDALFRDETENLSVHFVTYCFSNLLRGVELVGIR